MALSVLLTRAIGGDMFWERVEFRKSAYSLEHIEERLKDSCTESTAPAGLTLSLRFQKKDLKRQNLLLVNWSAQ